MTAYRTPFGTFDHWEDAAKACGARDFDPMACIEIVHGKSSPVITSGLDLFATITNGAIWTGSHDNCLAFARHLGFEITEELHPIIETIGDVTIENTTIVNGYYLSRAGRPGGLIGRHSVAGDWYALLPVSIGEVA